MMASRILTRRNGSQASNRLQDQTEEFEATLNGDQGTMDNTVLERLFGELSEIKMLLKEIKEQRTLEIPNQPSTTNLPTETQVNIVNALTSVKDAISNMQTTNQDQADGNTNHTEALRIKQSITQTWNRNLEFRKDHYWQHIRNNLLAETYGKWIDMTPIIIPKKLQVVKIATETGDQTKLRERQVISNYRFEIEKLKLLAGSHLQKVQSVDENMISLIERKSKGQTKEQLNQLWNEEVKQNETISHRIMERKNIPFLETYKKEFTEKHQTANPYLKEFEPRNQGPERNQRAQRRNNDQFRNQTIPRLERPRLQTDRQRLSYAEAAGTSCNDRATPQNFNQRQYQNQTQVTGDGRRRYARENEFNFDVDTRTTHQNFNQQTDPNFVQTDNRNRWYNRENDYNYGEQTTYIGRNAQQTTRGYRPQMRSDRSGTEQTQTRRNDDHFLGRGRGRGQIRPQH